MLASRFSKLKSTKRLIKYNPNSGYIGQQRVEVANYLFTNGKTRKAYAHSKELVRALMGQSSSDLLEKSERLTEFLRKRDLTFQKSKKDGSYQIFTVPCTTTVVPLPKSVFNQVELAAQVLVVALRKVLQSIYGAASIEESEFVKALPEKVRLAFISAAKSSAHYLPQLHHPNMLDYPFFDNVGLDLVLVEEYFKKSKGILNFIESGREDDLPELPFKILELNAGAPSGASNNLNILEGIQQESPEILATLDRVLPNDHFTCLKDTFRSLGEGWTKTKDAVQVLLPPGGSNGAAPEIHQLAAYSGLIYCDPGQLYCDDAGWIRLRTITGSNPIVNSIYSRINADSALYDPAKGLFLRHPDSGASLYCVDTLKPWKNGKPVVLKDENGKPVPLESEYTIPGAIDAILNRRLYMGGLNRLLDNKIILATLTEFAPKIFQREILQLGLNPDCARIDPPQCLPSDDRAIEIIERKPDDWVVKSPSLSGGTGVHILMTLDQRKRREVIQEAKKSPEMFAYQRIVRIGRIPVAVKTNRKRAKVANLAADIRMWVFYGGENISKPKLTHNALVRYAPVEKGAMSSIVNTSKGGGYAPFVVIDDTNDAQAITAAELAKPIGPAPFSSDMPIFVAAQIIQVSRLLKNMKEEMVYKRPDAFTLYGLVVSLKDQCREITSFLHPKCMESVHSMIDLLEKRFPKKETAVFFAKYNYLRATLVENLKNLESYLSDDFFTVLDGLLILDETRVARGYTIEDRKMDSFALGHLNFLLRGLVENKNTKKAATKLKTNLRQFVALDFPQKELPQILVQQLWKLIDQFVEVSEERIRLGQRGTAFAHALSSATIESQVEYQDPLLQADQSYSSAQEEWVTGLSLLQLGKVRPHVQKIRERWLERLSAIQAQSPQIQEKLIREQRAEHFLEFPQLKDLQALTYLQTNANPAKILEILDFLPYAENQIQRLCKKLELKIDQIFSTDLVPNRICILNETKRRKLGLSGQGFIAGECFARKRSAHGLLSDSDIYLWISEESSPLIQAYTLGHEIGHWFQINDLLGKESAAIEMGPVAHAEFLSWYGALFSESPGVVDAGQGSFKYKARTPLYGLADRIVTLFFHPVIKEIRHGLERGRVVWDALLKRTGGLYGYMFPNSPGVRIKAIREVVPALENGKNIVFISECGLEVSLDPVRSVIPTASPRQVERLRSRILDAIQKPAHDFEALRLIASHQIYGVWFARKPEASQSLNIKVDPLTIYPMRGYNQTEQQQ